MCSATTVNGNPCSFTAKYAGMCVSHASKAGNPAAKEEMRQRGANGTAKARINRDSARLATPPPLRTVEDLLRVLERALMKVENSGCDAVQKANAAAKMVERAQAILKDGLEREVTDLHALISEHMPHLKKRLRAVP